MATKWKTIARHKDWVRGATISESTSNDGNLRRFVATIGAFRNWQILECSSVDARSWSAQIIALVGHLKHRIESGDESVFTRPQLLMACDKCGNFPTTCKCWEVTD